MPDITVEEYEYYMKKRPYVVILGAGASCAAIPDGDKYGRKISAMSGFIEKLGFWGILKREMYYGKKYHTREELVQAITEYIDYYINGRPQRCLDVLTPFEFHERLLAA